MYRPGPGFTGLGIVGPGVTGWLLGEKAMRLLKLLLVLYVSAIAPAVAQPLEEGLAAAQRGDYASAAGLLGPLAEQGNPIAQINFGLMHENGHGVPRDYVAAVSWYRKAAEQGNARGQTNLGTMYVRGLGVPQDYAAAASWFRRAADQGESIAQYNFGVMYENGHGVPKNDATAVSWYRKAADQGHAGAQKKLQVLVGRASVQMKKEGGTYVVPVLINNAITLDFTVDSGATDVAITEDVVSTLIRTGTIKAADFIGEQTYVLADGSKIKSKTFRIRSLKVGDRVLENVTGSVAGINGALLLGQSFLGRFKSWSIDNTKHALMLE